LPLASFFISISCACHMTTYWLLSTVLVIALFPAYHTSGFWSLAVCKNGRRKPRDLPCDLRHSWCHGF